MCSILKNVCFIGDGRDSRILMNLDVNRLLIIVILPIVVSSLGVQTLKFINFVNFIVNINFHDLV